MATRLPNRSLKTREATISVDTTTLSPGRYRIQLVVIDDQGLSSQPDVVEIALVTTRTPGLPGTPIVRPGG